MAPPTMAVTMSPDNSFALAGIASTVIEKINGKMLAKPRPIMKILVITIYWPPSSRPTNPRIENNTVTIKKFLGDTQLRISAPRNLPVINAIKKKRVPSNPSLAISYPNASCK